MAIETEPFGTADIIEVCGVCGGKVLSSWKTCLHCWHMLDGRPVSGEALGRKDDAEKLQWHLMPWNALKQVVLVLMFGAKKYGANNWKTVPNAETRYLNAAIRHTVAALEGEELDPESGLPHKAHAVCCLLFALCFMGNKKINGENKMQIKKDRTGTVSCELSAQERDKIRILVSEAFGIHDETIISVILEEAA